MHRPAHRGLLVVGEKPQRRTTHVHDARPWTMSPFGQPLPRSRRRNHRLSFQATTRMGTLPRHFLRGNGSEGRIQSAATWSLS